MIINKKRGITCGMVQFAIKGSGKVKKSARQTNTIPPAVIGKFKKTLRMMNLCLCRFDCICVHIFQKVEVFDQQQS